ncbi:Trigger factor [Dissostichus eleginoides]|uniref:Trigger factor n=1 Tax=Dissostichus eleginoides TaxID=100907 RepID=A0AAD9CHY9_DISEL|nr:Trigger factor [Dissostichus eleginoides]
MVEELSSRGSHCSLSPLTDSLSTDRTTSSLLSPSLQTPLSALGEQFLLTAKERPSRDGTLRGSPGPETLSVPAQLLRGQALYSFSPPPAFLH